MSSLEILLAGALDYAGLFPPAALALPDAWGRWLAHLQGQEAWTLGGFVLPAARLPELAPLAGADARALELVLLAACAQEGPPQEPLEAAAQAWREFSSAKPQARVRGWELRLPAPAKPDALLEPCASLLPGSAPVFWEADPRWTGDELDELAAALARLGAAHGRVQGLKLRCGGVGEADTPSARRVAQVLHVAAKAGLALKLTAGLHHPLGHVDPASGRWMHGFINVYFAALAARVHGLQPRDLAVLLEESRRDAFRLERGGLRWRELVLDAHDLAEGRRWLAGHGTCSVDEPVADLDALGWWPAHAHKHEE